MTSNSIDHKRHFQNKSSVYATTDTGGTASPPPWDAEACTTMARDLVTKCIHHYEHKPKEKQEEKTVEKKEKVAEKEKEEEKVAQKEKVAEKEKMEEEKGVDDKEKVADHTVPHISKTIGTLYCGGLGSRVYLRLRLAQHLRAVREQQLKDKTTTTQTLDENEKEIQTLLQDALDVAQDAVEIEVERMKRHSIRVSLLEGPFVGAKALLAAVHHALGQTDLALQVGTELLEWIQENTSEKVLPAADCEVLYGRAGAMQAILFLRQELEQENGFGSDLLVSLTQAIVQQGLKTAAAATAKGDPVSISLPLLWEWQDKTYLGAAHGMVGILHTILCLPLFELEQISSTLVAEDATNGSNKKNGEANNLLSMIQETIRGLDDLCWPGSGNLPSSYPRSSSSRDKLVQWCHGAPGHVLLLVKASEVYQDQTFLDRARELAVGVIWQRGILRKGVGLCHGISGNAYSLLSLARPPPNSTSESESEDTVTARTSWMQRTCHFAATGMERLSRLENIPDHPYSVFEGAGGLALLMMELGILLHPKKDEEDGTTTTELWKHGVGRFPLYDF